MKIVNRIIFGLIVAVGIMLVAQITDEYFRSRAIIAIAEEKLANETYTDLISAAYYDEVPVFQDTIIQNDQEFLVFIYQAAHITQSNQGLIVLDGFQLLVIQKEGELFPDYFDINVYADQDIVVNYTGFNLYKLGMYSLFNPNTQGSLILENYYLSDGEYQTIRKIVFDKEGEVILELDVELTQDMLTIAAPLEAYIEANGEAPNEALDDVNYNEPLELNFRDKVARNMAIYLVVVILVYYLVFIRKPKTLGKDKVTEGLQKDIEHLKDNKKSDL